MLLAKPTLIPWFAESQTLVLTPTLMPLCVGDPNNGLPSSQALYPTASEHQRHLFPIASPLSLHKPDSPASQKNLLLSTNKVDNSSGDAVSTQPPLLCKNLPFDYFVSILSDIKTEDPPPLQEVIFV